jgi:hypothetical protein
VLLVDVYLAAREVGQGAALGGLERSASPLVRAEHDIVKSASWR